MLKESELCPVVFKKSSCEVIKNLSQKNEELRKINEELEAIVERKTKKLLESQSTDIKLKSVGKLAAGITHEINTPLTYIKGNVEMLKYELEDLKNADKSSVDELLNEIMEGVNRISSIIESTREISKISSDKQEITNIFTTIIYSLRILHNRAKHICPIYLNGELFDISIERDKEIYYSNVAKQQIEQIWIVIINNALDEFSASAIPYENRKLNITIGASKESVVVRIIDNAGGIREDIMEKIFDPFESTKEHSGMGLGLNIAKELAHKNKGEISAYNQNGGAVLEVVLPLENPL